ncbi:S8 family peptidase [Dokdonia sp.]|uniref:S8 family peptidase n=1 Tax=Dokdonia sp. TaxID=2024995 RepID=UPI00326662A9
MKKTMTIVIVFITVLLTAQESNYVSGEILIQLKKNHTISEVIQERNDVTILSSKLISRPLNIYQLTVDITEETEQEIITFLYRNSQVLIAQLNHYTTIRSVNPDDNFFDQQWQYFQENDQDIDANDAWSITTGGTTINGDVIVAAAVDTGYNIQHPDLQPNLYVNTQEIPNNNIDDDQNGYIDDTNGWNAYTNNGIIVPSNHGSSVFGIIGAKGNNGTGVSGVNWNIKVMTVSGSSSAEGNVLESYSYILESRMLYNATQGESGAFVVATNASFGIDFGQPEDSPLWCAMYDTLGAHGILSCGATINGDYNVDIIGDVPTGCSSEYLLSITNTTRDDIKETEAGYGLETIDLGAPGTETYTTKSEGYGHFGGTSAATPHVTGAISLLYSVPCQTLADLAIQDPQRAAQIVRDLILDYVDPNPSLESITTTGGRLNVNNSIQALINNCDTLLSITESTGFDGLLMYPNPAKETLHFILSPHQKVKMASLFTIDGRHIQNSLLNNNSIPIDNLPKGMYILKLQYIHNATPTYKTFIKK